MKHTLLFLFVFLFGFNLSAQDFVINPAPVLLDSIYDLTDEFYIMKTHSTLTNNSTIGEQLRWVVTKVDVPEEWQFQLCDNNACFGFGQRTNVDDNIDQPVEVTASGGTTILDLGVRHRGVAGCGTYRVDITTIQDTTVILASNTYELRANVDANCLEVTSTNNFEKAKIKVFPNPTNDYFTITDNVHVKEVQVFNIVGKQMAAIPFENGKAINVTSFPNGLYLIRMLDEDQQIIKTTRLTKR